MENNPQSVYDVIGNANPSSVIKETTTLKGNIRQALVDTSDGAVDIILPNVTQIKNGFFSITRVVGGNNVVIKDQGDSNDWSNITLSAVGAKALLFSDGYSWFQIN